EGGDGALRVDISCADTPTRKARQHEVVAEAGVDEVLGGCGAARLEGECDDAGDACVVEELRRGAAIAADAHELVARLLVIAHRADERCRVRRLAYFGRLLTHDISQ